MQASARDPLVGRLVAGRYRVLARVARGGMATVYRAEDVRLGREIALKVMHPHLAESDDFVARFHDEARAAASLSHRHVVAVHDQGDDEEVVWLAMELLPGRTLRDALRERGAFTPAETFEVMEAVLLALVEAHSTGLVHRDVKPENVLLARDGTWKVNDFGLARAASSSRTATGSLLGTPEYIAPETARTGQVDERVDLYSAGIMFFELLTGRQPHTGEVPFQVVWSHVTTDVPPPSRWAPYLPRAVDELVADACERDPEARVRTAATMLADLRRVRSLLDPGTLDRRPAAARPGVGRDARYGGGGPEVAAGADGATRVLTRAGRGVAAAPTSTRTLERAPQRSDGSRDPFPEGSGRRGGSSTTVTTRGRRRGPGLAGVLLVLLVLSLGAGASLWYVEAGPGAMRVVPDVTGRTVQAAQQQLLAAGLASSTSSVFDEAAPEGSVVGSSPAVGEQVNKNGSVDLLVSAGPELFGVPDLRGEDLDRARELLEGAGLAPGPVAEAYSSEVPEGRVLSTDPTVGADLRGGSEVGLVVSRGPEPVEVPDVTGGSRDDARGELEDAGLRLGSTSEEYDPAEEGTVLAQDPSTSTLPPGEVVDVVVSLGPEPVTVPDVSELSYDDAVAELEGLGLVVERRGPTLLGRVVGQEPSAGTELAPGSTVVLTTF